MLVSVASRINFMIEYDQNGLVRSRLFISIAVSIEYRCSSPRDKNALGVPASICHASAPVEPHYDGKQKSSKV